MRENNGEKKEESKAVEPEKLEVAWRYNNLLKSGQNPNEINKESTFGKEFPLVYKFDNSKPMGETIHNALSYNLDKKNLLHLMTFDN